MKFKQWFEEKSTHINQLGHELSNKFNLIRGKKAWNQSENNCYAIASEVAKRFGFVPVDIEIIETIVRQYQSYWLSKHTGYGSATPPSPKQGIANFIIRIGPEYTVHTSFEYKNKEYNYGPAVPEGFEILFRIGLKKQNLN